MNKQNRGLKQQIQQLFDETEKHAGDYRVISVIRHLKEEVLEKVDSATQQIEQIMNEDYWTANFHLNEIRTKILAVLNACSSQENAKEVS